ncbi:hypothetical protein [Microbacterium resistens]
MSSKTVRQYVLDELTPHVPETWKVFKSIPTLKTLSQPTMWLEYSGFEPLPAAPLSSILASVDVCVATNLTDIHKGEDKADEYVARLYEAAFASNKFYGLTAQKTVFAESYIGWRITIQVVTTNPAKE